MPTDRERRLALNEAAFRVANERKHDWPERRGDAGALSFYCECADPDCHEHVQLRGVEYEHVRSDPHRFVVVPGHEVPDVETVIERNDGFAVIEKDPEVHPIVEASDPRGG